MQSLSPTRVSPKISSDKLMIPHHNSQQDYLFTQANNTTPPREPRCILSRYRHVPPRYLFTSFTFYLCSLLGVLARKRGDKGTAPMIFKHLSHKPTPTPPQKRSSFHTHENLQTVEKLLLKPLNNSYELLQSYQSQKFLRKRVENEEERFQRPLDPKNISCTCLYGVRRLSRYSGRHSQTCR